MRQFVILAAIFCFQAPALAQGPVVVRGFEVHEWGTFTSMQGSNGVGLEGLHHEEEALPRFVHSARTISELPPLVKLKAQRVTQKMETPVIYFHTEDPLRVQVDVQFLGGLMTQYYPIPQAMWPTPLFMPELLNGGPIDMSKVKSSGLSWMVDLIPYGVAAPVEVPRVSSDDPWALARQVRAAYVRNVEAPNRITEAEHYIFYRGLGRFSLPISVSAGEGGLAMLRNKGRVSIPFAAALEVTEEGARFRVLDRIPMGDEVSIGLEKVPLNPNREWVGRELGARVLGALVDRGLFADEARAMVATWSRQWFQSRGNRVIYIVPKVEVERMLPLSIDPAPEKIVRVLVGRLEYITPEMEARVQKALGECLVGDPEVRAMAEKWLLGLDRFLEPHLRRAVTLAPNDEVRQAALQLLENL